MTRRDDFTRDHTIRVHATVERCRVDDTVERCRADATHSGWYRVWSGDFDVTIRRDLSDTVPTPEIFATQAATMAVSRALDAGWHGTRLLAYVTIDSRSYPREVDLVIGMTTRVIQQGPVAP